RSPSPLRCPARPGSCRAWTRRTHGRRTEGRSAVASLPVTRSVSSRGWTLGPGPAQPRTSSPPSAPAPRPSAPSASRDTCARPPGACRSSAHLTVQRVEAEVRDPLCEVRVIEIPYRFEDVPDVTELGFRAGVSRPIELRDHQILRSDDEQRMPVHRHPSLPRELRATVHALLAHDEIRLDDAGHLDRVEGLPPLD